MITKLILSVIKICSCFALCFSSIVYAVDCPVPPTEVTNPQPTAPEMTYPDLKGRDFEFYDKSYALLIGESRYPQKPLTSVPAELRKLRSTLEGQGFDVSLYLDLKSTEFSNAIECFIAKVGYNPKARVVVYIASHGITRTPMDKPIGYLLPIDALLPTSDPKFALKAIRISKFLDWAEALEVKHALFVFDACFSGTIMMSRSSAPSVQPSSGYVFSDNVQKPLRIFFASGTAEQEVPANSFYANLLTQALLGERIEADSNRDGYLTGTELAVFLENEVPTYSKQTPVHGRILDETLDIGEIIFKLPNAAENIATSPSNEEHDTTLQPLFIGSGNETSIVQLYVAEKLLNTSIGACDNECISHVKQTPYSIIIDMPHNLPGNAIFTDSELTCSGCTENYAIVSSPRLSNNARTLTTTFSSWEKRAVWKLRGKVSVPKINDNVVVVNGIDNQVTHINQNKLTVAKNNLGIKTEDLNLYNSTVIDLQSEKENIRREARKNLSEIITQDDGSKVAVLVRGMNTSTYRYQIGIADALSKAPDGWSTTESVSRDTLVNLKKSTTDPTLKNTLQNAIDNIQFSVFYETGDDHWLTKNGQLRPLSTNVPPLPDYYDLKVGARLVAQSTVYKRAGPGIEFGTIGALDKGECVDVISKGVHADDINSKRGGWLRVVTHQCK